MLHLFHTFYAMIVWDFRFDNLTPTNEKVLHLINLENQMQMLHSFHTIYNRPPYNKPVLVNGHLITKPNLTI